MQGILLSQISVLKETMGNHSLTTFFILVMVIQASSYFSFSQLFLVYVSLSFTETIPYPQLSRWWCIHPRMDFHGEYQRDRRTIYTVLVAWKMMNAHYVCPVHPALRNIKWWSFINMLIQKLKHSMTHYRDSVQFSLARQITVIY